MSQETPVTEHPILLDRNENQYGPAPACFEVLRHAGLEELSTYSRDYERKVKSRLSERLAASFGLPEEHILLSYGSEDMLKQAVHCYLPAGEKILIPNLSWWYYRSVASEVDGVTLEYTVHEGAGKFSYDADELLHLLKSERPRILLIASPTNPTGHSISRKHFQSLLRGSGDTMVILDEAYEGFSENAANDTSQLVSEHDNLLALRTFSKFYALAGARIGYALAGKKLDRLAKFSARYLGYNRLSEELALSALDSMEYYDEMRQKIVKERENYIRELKELPGWKPYASDANFLLARIPEEALPSLRRWLERKRIAIKYYVEGPLHNSVRITVGREDQNRLLLSALREFVQLSVPAEQAVPR